ncbi:response regulator transcription factor [Megamonas hypermegale]|uniref:response regulator transcription factor n=1 Tax=Megamonas hypermegale TaxID=158847 RepID=UPI0032097329
MIRVVIADDQELIRTSLKIILSTHKDLEIVGVAADGFEVLDILKQKEVDIVLMDIRMPHMDGVYCTKVIKEQYPATKVVILTTFNDDDFVFSALKYGASGYLLKDVSMDELYSDIVTVYKGINPDIATKVFSMFTKMSQHNMIIQVDESFLKDISKTEWKVIQQVGCGLSNKEIAQKLFLSEGTVRNYLSSILSKLNLRDRTQLAIWAVQTGKTIRDFDNE